MVVLFAKLENMLQNSLYVNILLTGIVAQLACYPQPLIRSFLLNTNMVFQPSVKSLIQVLCTIQSLIRCSSLELDLSAPGAQYKAKKIMSVFLFKVFLKLLFYF